MNIGIVTQPLSRNYGGILQNYALQCILKSLGHTPYTFDLGLFTWKDWIIFNLKSCVKKLIGRRAYYIASPKSYHNSEMPLRRFVDTHISLIAPRTRRPSASAIHKYGLECIIVGSDQVWRPKYNINIADMYLSFATLQDIKRVAYAASFGTDVWEYRSKDCGRCRRYAQKFDAISVREDSAISLCRTHLGVDASLVLDPTLLLSSDDYSKLITHQTNDKKPYLFAYLLDISNDKIEYVQRVANILGIEPRIVKADNDITEDDSIEMWLSNIRNARYVITDSFHGCAFSIIFNREFITFGNKARGNSRIYSLLKQLNLENRIVQDNLWQADIHNIEIEWQLVNSTLEHLKDVSINFLRTNIK